MIKNYLPDGRITENTNLLYFCHGTDQTGFFQDFFECRVGKNQFVQQWADNRTQIMSLEIVFSLEDQYFINLWTVVSCNIVWNVNCRL
jgi:hypothetical protein